MWRFVDVDKHKNTLYDAAQEIRKVCYQSLEIYYFCCLFVLTAFFVFWDFFFMLNIKVRALRERNVKIVCNFSIKHYIDSVSKSEIH